MTNTATSLSHLSDHDWQIISNRHGRGIDWVVTKKGSRWSVMASLELPTYRTKTAAWEAATALVLREAAHRALNRDVPMFASDRANCRAAWAVTDRDERRAKAAGQRAAAAYKAGSSLG